MEVDGICLPLLLDTAAFRSLLSEPMVWRLFPHQKWMGCLYAFNHQLLIDAAVSQVIQPLRQLPLALSDDITAETAEAAGRWHHLISNLVVAKKKSGGLCPCVSESKQTGDP